MSASVDRKEASRKFKEQKPRLGAFAIRCTASGRVWVGSSRNLDATRNGSWFGLRLGSHQNKELQAEWNTYGEREFQYEILETLDQELQPLAIRDQLKETQRRWVEQLSAGTLL